jgi:site-specific recombinase XerD
MSTTLPALVEGPKTLARVSVETEIATASRYAIASKASASKRAYASDWRDFTAWCVERDLDILPAEPETAARYLGQLAETGLKISTIRRRSAAIAYFHRLRGFETPTSSELVKAVLAGISREKRVAPERKAPATVEVIKRLVRGLDDSLIGTRDRALLLLGFACALRRSELVGLNIEDLEETENGILVHIRRSKTDQEGEGHTIAVQSGGKLKTIEAVKAWIRDARLTSGPLFQSIRKGGFLTGARLSDKAVALIVKRHAQAARLDPSIFAGHSLRAGFVTSAFDHGADAYRIADVTRHREMRTLQVYDRRGKFEKHAGRGFL